MDTRTERLTHTSTPTLTRRPLRTLIATACVAFAATMAQTAIAQPAGGGAGMAQHGGPGMGMMAHEGGHDRHGMGMGMDGRHLERMLGLVNATPEQRAKIKTITDAARTDMKAQHEAGRKLHEQGQALFTQPTIDARAAEALRQQMLAQHDQASKKRLQTMLDVSAVLTPEQRKLLADRMGQRRAMMERHRSERSTLDGAKPTR
jgi:Spy/CpxP family protein refolding chaperone